MMRTLLLFLLALGVAFCESSDQFPERETSQSGTYLKVLGIAQDAGFPQIACKKDCCKAAWQDESLRKRVSCLGLTDQQNAWLLEATPNIRTQLQELDGELQGIFLTHAHMGHYTGLMHVGREALGADQIPVYAMPRMDTFLRSNGPWSQLVGLKNIMIRPIQKDSMVRLSPNVSIQPIQVPHRDEFSETVGFHIHGPTKSALFIPDIDKWHLWEEDIVDWIKKVDYALLDGTFYQNGEIPGRDMSQIPHPFIQESLALFESLSAAEKQKVIFIHFNHTNPLLKQQSKEYQEVIKKGYRIASEGMEIVL